MALTTIALIGATAALCATIFKEKESRVKDVIGWLNVNENRRSDSPHFQILEYDINTYLTGVDDAELHPILLEIMRLKKKPVGYFSPLNKKLKKENGCYITIKKLNLWDKFKDNNGMYSFSFRLVNLCIVIYFANGFNNDALLDVTISVFLSIIAGFYLYDWLRNISGIWAEQLSSKKITEFQQLFDEYANMYSVNIKDANEDCC